MVKIMETPIKMDDLGVPLFLETPTCLFTAAKMNLKPYPSQKKPLLGPTPLEF